MKTGKSDSPTKCGLCGGEAYTPRDVGEGADGIFNVCRECGAECTGTGAYTETERWHWTDRRTVAVGRARMEAAQLDAELAEDQRWGDY